MSFTFSFRSAVRVRNVAWSFATGSAFAVASCSGPDFSSCASGSCDEAGEGGEAGDSHLPPGPAGSAGQAANGGEAGAPRGTAGGVAGQTESGGSGGDSGAASEGHGGDATGVAGAAGHAGSAECSPSSCNNGDPTDGEETCVEGQCVAGNAPPDVVSVSPARSATDQEPNAPIVVEFTEEIAPATLTAESLVVEAGGVRVPGVLSLDDSKLTATFTPSARFPLRGLVTLKVTTSVTDLEGAAMLDEFSSGFWVRDGEWSVPEALDTVAPLRTGRHVPVDAAGNVLVTFIRSGEIANRRAFSRFYHPGVGLSAFVEHSESATPSAVAITSALNDRGVGSVLWRQTAQFAYGVWSRTYHDGQWSARPNALSFEGVQFATAVSPDDAVHLAAGYSRLNLRCCDLSNSCYGAAQTPTDAKEHFPSFAFDAQGNGIAVWRREQSPEGPGGIVVANYLAGAKTWGEGTVLGNAYQAEVPAGSEPKVAMTPEGQAIVIWVEEGVPPVGSTVAPRVLLVSHYNPSLGWGDAIELSRDLGDIGYFAPSIAYDGTAMVAAWVAREDAGTRIYTRRFGSTVIEPAQRRDEPGAIVLGVMPQLATDRAGDLVLTWLEASPNPAAQRLAYQRRVDGVWSSTAYMSELVRNGRVEDATLDPAVQLGMGSTGVAAVLWEQRGPTALESLWLSVLQ